MLIRRAGELGVDTRALGCRDKRLVDPLLERLKPVHSERKQ
jgi:hypothetical protein